VSTVPVRRLRATPQAAALLLVAAGGWALTVPRALDMGSTPGTMGLSLAAFLVMWSLMMAAMMLPAIAAVTGLYVRTFTDRPWGRTAQLAVYEGDWETARHMSDISAMAEPGSPAASASSCMRCS